ncbi:yrdC domain-containing protein, mitochondrial [Dorcoceras hygrometricum]|uniref:Threonylcarbamoyl-AMP synthase n=1 Tax=Dorcoceras hygrometricum TaxID=472368 RepID=A0A2Z7BQI9_9LAMI|nr:yrdC domain-containing protein, mitochondrial [Dorcoceras hygrometricum]
MQAIIPAKFVNGKSLPFFSSSLFGSYLGVRKLKTLTSIERRRDNRGLNVKQMAWRLEKCDGNGMEIGESGVLRPAMEDYAQEVVKDVKAGKVIVVPTDTLYGFSCDACSMDAVHHIYEIKGRKYTIPLAICVGDVEDIQRFAVTDHLPNGLLNSLLPGPVTLVLRRDIKDFNNLWNYCAYIYDGGVIPSDRAGSTVVDLTEPGKYKILRPGR